MFCFSCNSLQAKPKTKSEQNSNPLSRPSTLPRSNVNPIRNRHRSRSILDHRPRPRPRPIGAQIPKHKAHGQAAPVTIIGLLARHERRQRGNRKPMEGPLAILAPQAAPLANRRVLVEKITVRTRGPEALRFDRTGHVPVINRFLDRVGKHGPGIGDELEGVVGEGERVLVGVKKKTESTVLFFDEIEVLARAIDLENSVPIEVVVGDWLLGSEEDIDDGQDLVGAFEEQLGFLREAP